MADSRERIPLPPATATRLGEWVRQRNEIAALIEATLLASREALGVPEGWILESLGEGFRPPTSAETIGTNGTMEREG